MDKKRRGATIKAYIKALTQRAITCSKITVETLEPGVKYVYC